MASPERSSFIQGAKEKIAPITAAAIGLFILVKSFPINSIVNALTAAVGGGITYFGGKRAFSTKKA